MTYVFNENAPTLDVVSPNSDKEQGDDEREGFKFLFMGSAQALRNPRGHGGDLDTPEDEAAEMLALASLLMRALDRAEEQLLRHPVESDDTDESDSDMDDDDEPGTLDQIVIAEGAMPKLNATIEEMSVNLSRIGSLATEHTPKVNAAPTMAARLVAVNAFATEVNLPTQRFRALAADYVGQMVDLNGGIDALIHMQPYADMSAGDQAEYVILAKAVRGMRDAAIAGVAAAANLGQQFRDVSKLSKSLKKPSADIRDGVRQMQSVQHYYDEWVDGFREAGGLTDDD
jgi:hypothetical protein